ncbi:Kinesin light chain 3, partial [Rhizophlyctis rosea]
MNAISSMQNVLMVLTPWNAPLTLTRAWCVFELYACNATKSHLGIALPPKEISWFRNTLKTAPPPIQKVIRESGGFAAIDQMILDLLIPWMVNAVRSRLWERDMDDIERARWQIVLGSLYDQQGMFGQAERYFVDSLDIKQRKLGVDHPETLQLVGMVAKTYVDQAKYERAQRLLLVYRDEAAA